MPLKNVLMSSPASHKHKAKGCDVCGRSTSEDKPLCIKHILDAPYASVIASTWDDRLAELAGRKPPNLILADAQIVVASVISESGYGFITTTRLARDLQATDNVAAKVARLLGMRKTSTRRGDEAWKPSRTAS